jgi:hypothetical protein
MYYGILKDRETGQTVNFRNKTREKVLDHFKELIISCNLEKIQIKIILKTPKS